MGYDPEAAGEPLAYRVIHVASAPLLLLDPDLSVVAASDGYRQVFVDAAPPEGRPVQDITGGAWREPHVLDLLHRACRGEVAQPMQARVICPAGLRQVRVGVRPTTPEEPGRSLLVMAIEDHTDASARAAQLRDIEALLEEAHHRTANNLAMISSILALRARAAQLDETRAELEGARRRVLAMATIERHLQVTHSDARTAVRPYLQALMRQLAQSLLGDTGPIALELEASTGRQPRRTAVIIGLVVTELVINALKYAFPRGQAGRIAIEYWDTDDGWCAAVTDNGCGLPADVEKRHGGFDIVNALAAQLGAEIRRHSSPQGLRVELCCDNAKLARA